ncbi:STAS domain-containing protein [Spirosomataceae bacterium TFI 002]|nr:STAS domain-containing protein [Spirosomataceae bacterium TFI 002]
MQKIIIEGDLTTEKALEWKNKLNKAAQESDGISLDLTGVKHADIVGANAIISTFKILKDAGKKMSFDFNKNSEIYELLHLTKFVGMLPK